VKLLLFFRARSQLQATDKARAERFSVKILTGAQDLRHNLTQSFLLRRLRSVADLANCV